MLASLLDSPWLGLFTISAAGLAHSARAFIGSGGRLITAAGIFALGTGLFAFFPGLYLSQSPAFDDSLPALLTAVGITFFSQILMYHLFWEPKAASVRLDRPSAPQDVTRFGAVTGVILIGVGLAGSIASYPQPLIWNSFSYVGIVFLAASVFQRPEKTLIGYVAIMAGCVLYAMYIFTGYGRLQLGTLGFALAMLAALRWPERWVKWFLLAALVPGVLWLAQARAALVNERYGAGISETGLESIVAPLIRFSQLLSLESADRLTHNLGSSFWAAAVILVPRSIWPDKPAGLGPELLDLFAPQLKGTGHSEVAFYLGEWVLAFGVAGVVVALATVALVLRPLNSYAIRTFSLEIRDPLDLARMVSITLICSGLPDYVWAGAATYVSRVGSRLLVVALVILPLMLMALRSSNAVTARTRVSR